MDTEDNAAGVEVGGVAVAAGVGAEDMEVVVVEVVNRVISVGRVVVEEVIEETEEMVAIVLGRERTRPVRRIVIGREGMIRKWREVDSVVVVGIEVICEVRGNVVTDLSVLAFVIGGTDVVYISVMY